MIGRPGLPRYGITFAYGSNLDPDRLHAGDRCPDADEIGHVQLEGWRLEIFAGAADLEPDPTAHVFAVAWELTPADEERLDRREGAMRIGPDYMKIPLKARLADGTELDGYTYVMSEARRSKRAHLPTEEYREFLTRGYLRHGVDPSALDAAIARAADRDATMPATELLDVLRTSLLPCTEFTGACRGVMRWDPLSGHIPRGWVGGGPRLERLCLVLVTAEPGDPADGETYIATDVELMLRAVDSLGRSALGDGDMKRDGRPTPFHRNLRRILDFCWPGCTLDEQLQKTWITPTVLCSASISGGPVPSVVENACAKRYLLPQLQLLPDAFVLALGGKAGARLRRAGRRADAAAQHPSARPNSMPERSWQLAADAFNKWKSMKKSRHSPIDGPLLNAPR